MSQTSTPTTNHFLDLRDITAPDLKRILQSAKQLKEARGKPDQAKPLAGKTLVMIFEKSSTRTRISFEVGMQELGGHVVALNSEQMQLGRGETIADTARVISRYGHAIMLRANYHETLLELAECADIPVINGLTHMNHPCQILADMLTIEERLGTTEGKTLAWLGDGNNVANSLINAAAPFNYHLRLACPQTLMPDTECLEAAKKAGASIELCASAADAAKNADVIITDTWISMGDDHTQKRMDLLAPYQVDSSLMALAKPEAIFMHCLPAHRGEEVTAEVIDGTQSVVWDEAENRLHVQKAILLWCLDKL